MSVDVTLVGRLVTDPELRFTPSGLAVTKFTIVTSRRVKTGETWEDKDSTFWRCVCWRQLAENVAESLAKGDLTLAVGKVKSADYEDSTGRKVSAWEVTVEQIGPSLQWSQAKVSRTSRGVKTGADDPWAS